MQSYEDTDRPTHPPANDFWLDQSLQSAANEQQLLAPARRPAIKNTVRIARELLPKVVTVILTKSINTLIDILEVIVATAVPRSIHMTRVHDVSMKVVVELVVARELDPNSLSAFIHIWVGSKGKLTRTTSAMLHDFSPSRSKQLDRSGAPVATLVIAVTVLATAEMSNLRIVSFSHLPLLWPVFW